MRCDPERCSATPDLMELPSEPEASQQRRSYLPADLRSRLWSSVRCRRGVLLNGCSWGALPVASTRVGC